MFRKPARAQPLVGRFVSGKRSFRMKDAMGHERFCTVLLDQLSESRGGIRSMKIYPPQAG